MRLHGTNLLLLLVSCILSEVALISINCSPSNQVGSSSNSETNDLQAVDGSVMDDNGDRVDENGFSKFMGKVHKKLERTSNKILAKMHIDDKGKSLALIESVKKQARYVRVQFGQISFGWAPIVERALNYLGDKNLNKIKWDPRDPLDLTEDALNSLAFAYEFMLMLIGWRENLLVAHQAFLAWMKEFKNTKLDDPEMHAAMHATMVMLSWQFANRLFIEPRAKINFLVKKVVRSGKDFESDFVRDFTVLREMYNPIVDEFASQLADVEEVVADYGLTAADLAEVQEWFEKYRNELAIGEMSGHAVDWAMPEELESLLHNLRPQLEANELIYSKSFIHKLNKIKRVRQGGFWRTILAGLAD